MQEEPICNLDLIAMADDLSECRIDAKYFPLMFDSSFIIESLKHIYILRRIRRLSIEDILEVKQVFQENFNFFAEQYQEPSINNKKYSKKNLILSVLFFTLLLGSGIGCVYLPIIFVPLVIIFGICLVVCTCLINIKSCQHEIAETYEDIYNSCKYELFMLKLNLNSLRNSLAEKYQIKTTNIDSVDTSLVDNQPGNSEKKKKSVSFAPMLNDLNIFFIESPETRSRANSNESNANFQPKI